MGPSRITEPNAMVLRGLERWDRWLQEALAPGILRLVGWPGTDQQEFLWKLDFPLGSACEIRIPARLVEAAAWDFDAMIETCGETLLNQGFIAAPD